MTTGLFLGVLVLVFAAAGWRNRCRHVDEHGSLLIWTRDATGHVRGLCQGCWKYTRGW